MDPTGVSSEVELDDNKLILLAILYLYTRPMDRSKKSGIFIKEYALFAIIHYLILKKVLDYDYASRLKLWKGGSYAFVNISQEAIADLDYLINCSLVNKIRFSTRDHIYTIGYGITKMAIKMLDEKYRDIVEKVRAHLFVNGVLKKLVVEDDDAYLVYGENKEPIGCLRTEDVSYISDPDFM